MNGKTHLAVVRQKSITNLQRRKEVGTETWLEEQG